MKPRTIVFLAALAVALAFFLAGCSLIPMTIEARLTRFIEALNTTSRADVYTNFSATETADYDTLKAGTYWATPFPVSGAGELRYSITSAIDSSNPLAVLVTMAGPPSFMLESTAFKFVMVNEGTPIESWVIHELWRWDGVQYAVLVK